MGKRGSLRVRQVEMANALLASLPGVRVRHSLLLRLGKAIPNLEREDLVLLGWQAVALQVLQLDSLHFQPMWVWEGQLE